MIIVNPQDTTQRANYNSIIDMTGNNIGINITIKVKSGAITNENDRFEVWNFFTNTIVEKPIHGSYFFTGSKHDFYKNIFGNNYTIPQEPPIPQGNGIGNMIFGTGGEVDNAQFQWNYQAQPAPVNPESSMEWLNRKYEEVKSNTKVSKEDPKVKENKEKLKSCIDKIFANYPYNLPIKVTSLVEKKIKESRRRKEKKLLNVVVEENGFLANEEPVFYKTKIPTYRVERPINSYLWSIKENKNIGKLYYKFSESDTYKTMVLTNKWDRYFNDLQLSRVNSIEFAINATISCCRVRIKEVKKSSLLFGMSNIKKEMLLSEENKKGYQISDIIPSYKCNKDSKERDIIIIKGKENYKFVLSDVEIIFPMIKELKGINLPKDNTLVKGCVARITNNKGLKVALDTKVTVIDIVNPYPKLKNNNHNFIITVKDEGGNSFRVRGSNLKRVDGTKNISELIISESKSKRDLSTYTEAELFQLYEDNLITTDDFEEAMNNLYEINDNPNDFIINDFGIHLEEPNN